MPLQIVRNDITKIQCDAIVNAANPSLLGGGGVDGAIHRAAGKQLLEECKTLGGCKTGEAKITKGYNLLSNYVIHTVGPIWQGGTKGEEELLRSCYRNSLKIAADYALESVAFPLISSGAYGYPKSEALQIAVQEIGSFLLKHEITVYLVIFDKTSYVIGEKLFVDIISYMDDRYIADHSFSDCGVLLTDEIKPTSKTKSIPKSRIALPAAYAPDSFPQSTQDLKKESLTDFINQMDESFSEMLLRKIDEKGMTDADCYKKANIDRKLFSKIRSDKLYHPKKTTAIAFAIALELSLDETKEMLLKAGFALSHSNKFDIIIEYFITHQNYNIFEINEALFAFDQALLGV